MFKPYMAEFDGRKTEDTRTEGKRKHVKLLKQHVADSSKRAGKFLIKCEINVSLHKKICKPMKKLKLQAAKANDSGKMQGEVHKKTLMSQTRFSGVSLHTKFRAIWTNF